jgi:hypothetical protein
MKQKLSKELGEALMAIPFLFALFCVAISSYKNSQQ